MGFLSSSFKILQKAPMQSQGIIETECESSAIPRFDILFLGLTIRMSHKLASNIYIIPSAVERENST